ncbi:hypothetical protein H0H92_013512 [Tricholoma furcatifolium]|nr:hypothetical protein H0H92_013512 [Tricholoma furcatifolium]
MKKNSDGQWIPRTRLGVESIKQCISMLENWRHNHEYEFKDNPDALRPLREDSRIQTFEAKAQASESERNADAQISKAKGTTADTYTHEEIIRASMWCFRVYGSNQQIHIIPS